MKKILFIVFMLSLSGNIKASGNNVLHLNEGFVFFPCVCMNWTEQNANGPDHLVLSSVDLYEFVPYSPSENYTETSGNDDEVSQLYGNFLIPGRTDGYWLRNMPPNTDNIVLAVSQTQHS